MDILTKAQRDKLDLWQKLQHMYILAEDAQHAGEQEIVVPIDVFLYSKQIPRNVEQFWKQVLLTKQEISKDS